MYIKSGFSLIELLTVITIISLLASFATPAYRDYIITGKVASVFPVVDKLKIEVQDFFISEGVFPTASDLNFPSTGNSIDNPENYIEFAETIIIDNQCTGNRGEIAIVFSESLTGISAPLRMELLYQIVDGKLQTTCGVHFNSGLSDDSTVKFLPYDCQQRLDPAGSVPANC